MKLTDIKLNPNNPRLIKDEKFKKLVKSIKDFPKMMELRPIVVDKEMMILGGNMRYRALQEAGYTELEDGWVKIADKLTEEEKKRFIIEDNMPFGEWDWDILANNFSVGDLLEWGFSENELKIEQEEDKTEPIKDFKDIKILNLYSGIGGNRKLWGDLKITALEFNEEIANIYKDYFPKDEIIIGDAHKYLENNFDKFDFIWSSPPCPTHSLLRKGLSIAVGAKPKFPDMRLYEEILFLQGYHKGKFVVENVISWYDPLIKPQERGRHYYWSNFDIPISEIFNITEVGSPEDFNYSESSEKYGFNLDKYKISSKYPKNKILRNMVHPKVGKYILECAYVK